jgi:prepilin-type processing-associated H-X9-DG protein
MPYLELDNLQKTYTMNKAWDDKVNDGVSPWLPGNGAGPNQTQLKVLLCPSATAGRVGSNNRAVTDYAPMNQIYRNSAGVNPFLTYTPPPDPSFLGVLGHNVQRRITDVTDGSSNTMLLVEDAGRNDYWQMGKFIGAVPAGLLYGESGAWANPGSDLVLVGFNPAGLTDSSIPLEPGPCGVNCTNADEIYSFHAGVANVLMADGSVHAIKERTDINVVLALLTRNKGEIIPPDAIQ